MTADLALVGGRWERQGAIVVWKDGAHLELVGKARARRSLELIACPTCLATLTEQCKTASGNTTNHKDRLLKRRCPCGVPVRPRHRYCDRCGVLAREKTYRQREIRTPTRERRKAVA